MKKLVITQAFGDYEVGQEVTDAAEIKRIEETHGAKAVPVHSKPPPADEKADATTARK